MALQWGKNDVTNGVHLNKHIYLLHTYVQPCNETRMQAKQSCTYVQARKQSRDGNKDTSKEKHDNRIWLLLHRHLFSSTWQTVPQHSFKSKGMATPKDEGGRRGP